MSDTDRDWPAQISVVIPTYNGAAYIGRAVGSVLAQTRRADEIIVVDDGSTDNTRDIVSDYGSAVQYVYQANAGDRAARNRGIEQAGGEWIAFLDGDDEWLPEHLQLRVNLLQRYPELIWCTGNYWRSTGGGRPRTADLDIDRAGRLFGDEPICENYFDAYLQHATGWTGAMIVRRSALQEAGLFRVGQKRINDIDMWLRIAYCWPRIGYVAEPTAIYHMDVPGSIVKSHLDGDIIIDFADRHLALAAEHDCLEQFRPCAAAMICWWMQQFLGEHRGGEVRRLLRRYGRLYSSYFRRTMFISSLVPGAATAYERAKKRWRQRRPQSPDGSNT